MKSATHLSRRAARIRVPGSTSNLGAAFDAVGLAVELYLTVDIRETDVRQPCIEVAGDDARLIPRDESNLIWRIIHETAASRSAVPPPFALRIDNRIPITKGLGSSAAACLAGVAAANFLCGLGLTREMLLDDAVRREGHPDNVAPALYGGLVASIAGETILCSRSVFPRSWSVVAVTPDFELETKRARAVLPAQISREDAIYNVQRAAFLMSQMVQGRPDGLREAMRDRLHQPYRAPLLPGLDEILAMETSHGLLGVALSGAGSTVVAFADARGQEIGDRMRAIFLRHGLAAEVRILKADNCGLQIEEFNGRAPELQQGAPGCE
jgi:homoserine kinase